MAPRAPETIDSFLARLRVAVDGGADEVRFGQHHFTHAVCREEGGWVVRRLVCSEEAAEAYMAEHGMFMPEHAEQLAEPADVVMTAATLDDLETVLRQRPWPL